MTLKIFTTFASILLFGCNQTIDKSDAIFIVPADTKPIVKRADNEPPPPPPIKTYYFASNFIIDTGEHIYFYQQRSKSGWICGTGMEWDTPPPFIDLQLKDIVEIPFNEVDKFIMANVQYLDKSNRHFAIGSTADTITSVGLAKILETFMDTSNHITWTFRRTTQEENIVLKFKKNKEDYYSDQIRWDSTKILFPPNLENINFRSPKKSNKDLN